LRRGIAGAWGSETGCVKICRVRGALALAALVCASQLCASHRAAAQQSILPPVKHTGAEHGASRQPAPPLVIPRELAPPQEAYAAFPETAAAAATPSAPSACQLRLAKVATFQALPVLIGPGECGATDAVLLQTIILPDQAKVTIAPPATLRCPMAEEVAQWVRDDVAPAVLKLGAPVRGLDNFDSYECRGRNRVRGAILSEHGRADALDVRLFKLADGRDLVLTDVNVDKAWREGLKASACARFSTVLGPGSDGSHEEHIHLDLAERHNNYKVCEWDVRTPPPPPAQAAATPPAASDDAGASTDQPPPAQDDATATPPLETVPLPRPRPRHLVNAGDGGPALPK
jgi:hypothetical protein